MKNPSSLRDLLSTKIQALYDIESELVKALPKMAEAAKDEELKLGFTTHLEETKVHIDRLEQIFEKLEEKTEKLESDAIRGLVKDAEWVIENVDEGPLRDLSLANAARYVEHYEMAGYLAAQDLATLLEETEVAEILALTLEEEEATDEKLAEGTATIAGKIKKD